MLTDCPCSTDALNVDGSYALYKLHDGPCKYLSTKRNTNLTTQLYYVCMSTITLCSLKRPVQSSGYSLESIGYVCIKAVLESGLDSTTKTKTQMLKTTTKTKTKAKAKSNMTQQ